MNEANVIVIVTLGFILNLVTTIIAIVRISITVEQRLTKVETLLELIASKFETKYKGE